MPKLGVRDFFHSQLAKCAVNNFLRTRGGVGDAKIRSQGWRDGYCRIQVEKKVWKTSYFTYFYVDRNMEVHEKIPSDTKIGD